MLSCFPLDVLGEIWDLIESVSEGFSTYSSICTREEEVDNVFSESIPCLIIVLILCLLIKDLHAHQNICNVKHDGRYGEFDLAASNFFQCSFFGFFCILSFKASVSPCVRFCTRSFYFIFVRYKIGKQIIIII